MKKSFSSIFASRIRELRGQSSQSVFAHKIGTNCSSYSSWERGVKVPLASQISHIASVMGVSSDWLLGLTDNPQGLTSDEKIRNQELISSLEAQITALKGEIKGLQFALNSTLDK